ncbi:ATP-binding protein [Jeotgalibacillus haloalkalitolerans]|uniref:ATP-binding protein n=1 Tax=Jeotgalibacillus haloalkalitolerans TaxID=3104292 RepID=A0ABU5KMD4_9BACL|nr:ATP-binding protein [Jeotgalibacillus sp. HH7-29]MDZ5712228.1 ATP-binding protein [Jeotgalibacillus sp. HH7-29]
MTTVYLPTRFKRTTINFILEDIINEDLHPKSDEFTFDFSRLTFIEPAAITLLSNLFEWLLHNDVKVYIDLPDKYGDKPNCPIKFLDDSLFFKEYLEKPLYEDPHPRVTTLPLTKVHYTNSQQWIDNNFKPWLARRLDVHVSRLDTISMCIGEVFNNIVDHTDTEIGSVFAQHYPQTDCIKICVADFGIGIAKNIQEKYDANLTDREALILSIKEGFTTQDTPRNRGAGLATLVKNIVTQNKGAVCIMSNSGILSNKIHSEAGIIATDSYSYYPGTFIEIVLNTTNIEQILDHEEEFEWEF